MGKNDNQFENIISDIASEQDFDFPVELFQIRAADASAASLSEQSKIIMSTMIE